MERLGALLGLPPPPQRYVAGTYLYTWLKGDKVEKKILETTRSQGSNRAKRSKIQSVHGLALLSGLGPLTFSVQQRK